MSHSARNNPAEANCSARHEEEVTHAQGQGQVLEPVTVLIDAMTRQTYKSQDDLEELRFNSFMLSFKALRQWLTKDPVESLPALDFQVDWVGIPGNVPKRPFFSTDGRRARLELDFSVLRWREALCVVHKAPAWLHTHLIKQLFHLTLFHAGIKAGEALEFVAIMVEAAVEAKCMNLDVFKSVWEVLCNPSNVMQAHTQLLPAAMGTTARFIMSQRWQVNSAMLPFRDFLWKNDTLPCCGSSNRRITI